MLINRCSELRSSLVQCNAARDATGLSIAMQSSGGLVSGFLDSADVFIEVASGANFLHYMYISVGLVSQLVKASAGDSRVTCPEVISWSPTMDRSDRLKDRAVHQTME